MAATAGFGFTAWLYNIAALGKDRKSPFVLLREKEITSHTLSAKKILKVFFQDFHPHDDLIFNCTRLKDETQPDLTGSISSSNSSHWPQQCAHRRLQRWHLMADV